MQELLRLLKKHPEVLIIVVIWVVGFIASMLQKAKKAQEARRRRESLPSMQVPRQEPTAPVAMPAPAPPRPVRQDPEAVAREMRRILGMEPSAGDAGKTSEPEPVLRRRPVAEAPPPRPRPKWDASAERAPTPVMPTTQRRQLELHVDPHVGEGIRKRSSPVSGAVGTHAIGDLGGRSQAGSRVRRRDGSRLVDLHDLKRALVLREIFDAPLALRGRHLDER
ncbi:MAG: hypothetical protein IPK26_27080 [Planctomycetes bacterium]|nr:hypothetical protein [Planctomycetota bacterium]